MKAFLATALLAAVTATSAKAGVQFETRAFHSNLRVDAGRTTILDLVSGEREDMNFGKTYLNTAGIGFGLVAPATQTIDLGLGGSFARYNPVPGTEIDQEVIQAFSRIALSESESAKFYLLAAVSRHQLKVHSEGNEFLRSHSRYTPVLNSDLGLGLTIPVARGNLGFEYKHSNTIVRGRGTMKSSFKIPGFLSGADKTEIHDLDLEGQELSLTFGIHL